MKSLILLRVSGRQRGERQLHLAVRGRHHVQDDTSGDRTVHSFGSLCRIDSIPSPQPGINVITSQNMTFNVRILFIFGLWKKLDCTRNPKLIYLAESS